MHDQVKMLLISAGIGIRFSPCPYTIVLCGGASESGRSLRREIVVCKSGDRECDVVYYGVWAKNIPLPGVVVACPVACGLAFTLTAFPDTCSVGTRYLV